MADTQFIVPRPKLTVAPEEVTTQAEPLASQLTTCHYDVLELIADGLTRKEVADRIARKPTWVKYAIPIIYSALNVTNGMRTHAVRRGYEEGLLGPRKKSKEVFLSPPRLSDRELEYLSFISEGMMDAEVAHRVGLSPKTLKYYNGDLVRKLKARNRAHAVGIAIDMGFIDIEPQLKLPV